MEEEEEDINWRRKILNNSRCISYGGHSNTPSPSQLPQVTHLTVLTTNPPLTFDFKNNLFFKNRKCFKVIPLDGVTRVVKSLVLH